MRVVFTGISGIRSKYLLDRLKVFIESEKKKSVIVLDVEERLRSKGASAYYEFLDEIPNNSSAQKWSQSLAKSIRQWEDYRRDNGEPDFSFLSIHLVYHVSSHFYCPLTWGYSEEFADGTLKFVQGEMLDLLRRFKPHLFVNLFDNVYSCQKRIADYPFRLIELLRWRNLEALMTDIVSRQVITATESKNKRSDVSNIHKYRYEHSPMLAIRHPLDMVYRLIAERTEKRIYMAYPISEPREVFRKTGDDSLMKQVNSFRDSMRTHFIAFDPVTIDERPLMFLWQEFLDSKTNELHAISDPGELRSHAVALLKGESILRLTEDDLWPAEAKEYDAMLCGPRSSYLEHLRKKEEEEKGQKLIYKLIADEVRRVVEEKIFWASTKRGGEVDNQIARRDYRLIDQSDCVVIYRPSMGRELWPDGGTRSEYRYARKTEKAVLVLRDKKDGPFDKPPFVTDIRPFDVIEWEGLDDPEEGPKNQAALFSKVKEVIESRIEESLSIPS